MEVTDINPFNGIGTTISNGHSDIRNMPTEDGVLINSTKEGIDPFVEISKVPSRTTNGNLTGYGVELETDNGPRLVGTVSPSYLLVPNYDIYNVGQGICDASPFTSSVRRIFFDGARFAAIFDLHGCSANVEGRDYVQMSLVVQNSYNGTWAGSASLMAIDLFCQNGLLTGQHFAAPVKFKHVGDKDWAGMIEQGMGVLDTAEDDIHRFADKLSAMQRRTPDHRDMGKVLGGALKGVSGNNVARILRRFYTKEEPTFHGLLSAGTNVLWSKKNFGVSTMNQNRHLVDSLLSYVEA